jgi:hypothetical protein
MLILIKEEVMNINKNILLFILIIIFIFSCKKESNGNKIGNIEEEVIIHNNTENIELQNNINLSSSTEKRKMTHYVTENLKLRNDANLSSSIITILPKFSSLIILETGEIETIDGITAPWIKILSHTGNTGWCFSGYVEQIEDNIAEELVLFFESITPGINIANKSNSSSPENIHRLDADYLQYFTGKYVFDSYKIISQHNTFFDIEIVKNAVIEIRYNQDKNCLSSRSSSYIFMYNQIDFVETTAEEPFFRYYGEGAGNTESMLFFYKGGIAFYYSQSQYYPDEEERKELKYVVFFREKI